MGPDVKCGLGKDDILLSMESLVKFLAAVASSIALIVTGLFTKSPPSIIPHLNTEPILNQTVQGLQQNDLPVVTQPPQVQQKQNKTVLANPTAPVDPDPIIDCNSKTGLLKVRKSICLAYTDCPDDRGGYIFESLDACTKRQQDYANKINDLTKQFVNALKEQDKLQSQLNLQRLQNESQAALDKFKSDSQSIVQNTIDSLAPLPSPPNYENFIQEPSPSPTPSCGLGCGRLY